MKRFFLKGLFALLPIALTVVVFAFVIDFLYGSIAVPIGDAMKVAMVNLAGWEDPTLERLPDAAPLPPEAWDHEWFFSWGAPLIGFAVAIILTLVFGFLVATFLGNKLFQFFEWLLKKVPIVGTVYPYAKQFIEFFFSSEKKMEFKLAVAVPFPTKGLWSIGFVTGDGMKSLNEATGKHLLTIFVPTSPTPFTGYVIYVPREDVIPLPISVEEAIRIQISVGVLHPAHQIVTPSTALGPGSNYAVPEDLAKAMTETREGKKK